MPARSGFLLPRCDDLAGRIDDRSKMGLSLADV